MLKAQIEITNKCNINCKGCLREHMKRKQIYMNKEMFLKSLNLCKQMGVKQIYLMNWGEPLLHPNVLEFVKLGNKFDVGFTTNGFLLNDKKIHNLHENGLKYMDISYHYRDVEHIRNCWKTANSVGINCWIKVTIFSKDDYEKSFEDLWWCDKIKLQRGVYSKKEKQNRKKCKVINRTLFVINSDGSVVPCVYHYDNQHYYGKVGEITPQCLLQSIKSFNIKHSPQCKLCKEDDSKIDIIFRT